MIKQSNDHTLFVIIIVNTIISTRRVLFILKPVTNRISNTMQIRQYCSTNGVPHIKYTKTVGEM